MEGATPCRGRIYKAYIRRPGVFGTSCLDAWATKKAPLSGCTADLRCPTRPTRPIRQRDSTPCPLPLSIIFIIWLAHCSYSSRAVRFSLFTALLPYIPLPIRLRPHQPYSFRQRFVLNADKDIILNCQKY